MQRPSPTTVAAFRASLGRCLATPDFLRAFYERFIDSSDEVRAKFARTEFAHQTRVLSDSLYIMAIAAESRDESIGWRELDRLAARHARTGLDVRPALYDTWLECLLVAARQHDALFSDELEQAWRQTLAPGIERLRSAY